METLTYNSTNVLRLTPSQYLKPFGSSATPVAYWPLVIPCLRAIDWRASSFLKYE